MADYNTISKVTEGWFKDKGSKFTAYAHPIKSEEEAKQVVDKYKTEQPNAKHHCYAYRLDPKGSKFRSYDDGEPGGTAGKPILNQLLSNDLTNIIVIVVRYFGGTKLGVSGLINAYKEATLDAIKASDVIDKYICNYFEVCFNYEEMPSVMKWTKQHPILILNQDFNLNCRLEIEIKESNSDAVINDCPRTVKPKLLYTS
jgi:uncharacterized YigZ family protein